MKKVLLFAWALLLVVLAGLNASADAARLRDGFPDTASEGAADGEMSGAEAVISNVSAPLDLFAKPLSSSEIYLSWNDTSTDETGFAVERKSGGCSSANAWTQIASTAANVQFYASVALPPNTQFAYRVKAFNATVSAYSACSTAKTALAGTPAAPTGLRAVSKNPATVSISWNDNSADETRFEIYRKAGAGQFALLVNTLPDAKTYLDINAAGNRVTRRYAYYVRACNASGCSPGTAAAAVPYSPAAPAATVTPAGQVYLTWLDRSSNETGFLVDRKDGDCSSAGTWSQVRVLASNATAYTDSTVLLGNTYSYRIKSRSQSRNRPYAVGLSGNSNCAAALSAVSLPETGQTQCYDSVGMPVACSGTGQDGDFLAGVSWPDVRFVPGAGAEADCITDNLTGLMWPRNGNILNTDMTWQQALDLANGLDLCGHTDWRLPNINELDSLVHAGVPDLALHLNSNGFFNVQNAYYWTSTTRADLMTFAWLVSMSDGLAQNFHKYSSVMLQALPVRWAFQENARVQLPRTGQTICANSFGNVIACAGTGQDGDTRTGVAWPAPRFVAGAGAEAACIRDRLTGLMWPKDANLYVSAGTWQQALDSSNVLSLCGYTDWRLPNINELQSLKNYNEASEIAWLTGLGFTHLQSNYYWTSTSNAGSPNFAWAIWLPIGYSYPSNNDKLTNASGWPVRAGQ